MTTSAIPLPLLLLTLIKEWLDVFQSLILRPAVSKRSVLSWQQMQATPCLSACHLLQVERSTEHNPAWDGRERGVAHWLQSLVAMLHSATCLSREPEYSRWFPGPHATLVTGSECIDCRGMKD